MFPDKIRSGQSGILLYGITPPKADTGVEKIVEIAGKTVARVQALDIDALVVYDVQDESARTADERPFPLNALDPFLFANTYLAELTIPKIIYRPAGKFSPAELEAWLENLHKTNAYPIFVGVPAPDFPVKTSLPEAYRLWSRYKDSSVIGAVMIPERHQVLGDEDKRMLQKLGSGVSFFISQCIFDLGYAKQLLEDLARTCKEEDVPFPTVIFTLAACGSLKTLQFLEWLAR